MSRLQIAPGNSFDNLLRVAPGALEADGAMRARLVEGLTPSLFGLIGVAVAGLLRCERFVDALRGPLESVYARQVAHGWRKLPLTKVEEAILSYVERGTLDEASVRRSHVDELRAAGLADKKILLIATAVAYHNYSIRMAAAFDVTPR